MSEYYHLPSWLPSFNHNTLTRADLRILDLYWWSGYLGCDWWNYKIQYATGYSRRQVQLTNSKLYRLALIDVDGPFGQHRRIHAIRYPDQQAFMAAAAQQLIKEISTKLRPLHKRKLDYRLTMVGRRSTGFQKELPAGKEKSISGGTNPPEPPSAVQETAEMKKLIWTIHNARVRDGIKRKSRGQTL